MGNWQSSNHFDNMSNEEILQKAYRKARDNGWKPDSYTTGVAFEKIIFSHDFAKAFWGRKVIDNDFADEEGCSDPYVVIFIVEKHGNTAFNKWLSQTIL
jgi:hypothetical protein